MAKVTKGKQDKPKIDIKTQRRVLRFINNARSPQQIVDGPEKPFELHAEHLVRSHPDPHDIRDAHLESAKLVKFELAEKIIEVRDRKSPIHGFLTDLPPILVPTTMLVQLEKFVKVWG